MGAKKAKAKKGPKGKKARAKAKLEQVWGEHVDEEARQASKFRKGKSKFETNNTATQQHHKKEKEVDPLSRNRRGLKTSFESFLERRDNVYQKELEQKQQRQYAHQKKHRRYTIEHDGSSDDDDDSGSEDEAMDGVDRNGGSLSYLLKRINGPKKSSSRKLTAESDDDDDDDSIVSNDTDSDDGTESVSSSSSHYQQSHSDSDDNMDMDDDEEDVGLPKGTVEDPYEAHFSKQPLPQLDTTNNTNLMPHLSNSSKVDTSSLLSSSVQVHLSGPILDSWKALTSALPDKTKPRKVWRAFARGPQQHTRQILSRNWNSVNRSALKRGQRDKSENENDIRLSSLQQVLYPAISNYADVLISMESRQVSVLIYFVLEKYLHRCGHGISQLFYTLNRTEPQ
jgi:hypothetical protein